MKKLRKTKRNIISIIIMIVVGYFLFVGYSHYQSLKNFSFFQFQNERNENYLVEKKEEVNEIKLSEKKETKESYIDNEGYQIDPEDKPIKKLSEEEEAVLNGEIPKRKILPYDKALPPMPDPELVKTTFVDLNENGVRDDVEIMIVEDFEEDRDLVEAFFAEARLNEYDLYLVKNNLLDRDNLKKRIEYADRVFACSNIIFDSSEFSNRYNQKWIEYANQYDQIYFNTRSRKDEINKLYRAMHGKIFRSVKMTFEDCNLFFQSSLNW